jgi:hypothetical protein
MALDPTKNFLKETLASGYSLSATAITLPDASRFPNPAVDGAFNIVWWNVTDYPDPADDPNKEIVRVTAITGNIATITRAQEGTTATAKNLSGKTYQIALALTKKTMDDIDTTLETLTGDVSNHETRIDTAEGDITQIEVDLGVVEGDIATLESSKQDTLGFTPENVANKENTTLDTSTTKYPTNRLVKEAVDAKQNSLGFTPENVINKETDITLADNSDTKYPSQKAVKTYIDTIVAGTIKDRGNFDASVNTFPATGGSGSGGAIKKGDLWFISVAGTLGGVAVTSGDSVRALVDTPAQTASNWGILEANIGYVPENVTNKDTDTALTANSDTRYPSQKAVKVYIDTGLGGKQNTIGYTPENVANKDATGGYAGLTLFKINFKNALNTFTSFFTNANTASRTYTFPDRDGIIADDTDVNAKTAKLITTNRQTASYPLVLTDADKLVEMNVAGANDLTVPLNSSVAFPIGTQILLAQYGAGQTTVVATGGVTIRSNGGKLKLNVRYSGATLIKIATDEWYLFGDLTA